ncbi:MAG: carboxylesterase family protein, partial [Kiritimatiellaeota bacterium]|nr:carboxylesterase family protein [Kiritimatiellota bacterium]
EKGLQNDVPILTGMTANDFSAKEQPARLAALCAWTQWRTKFCKTPAYVSVWPQPMPDVKYPECATAFHGADLPYWFNNLGKFERPFTAADKLVADRASSYWVNFVKTGNPNSGALPAWQPTDASNPTLLSMGEKIAPRSFPTLPAGH